MVVICPSPKGRPWIKRLDIFRGDEVVSLPPSFGGQAEGSSASMAGTLWYSSLDGGEPPLFSSVVKGTSCNPPLSGC